jgi:hypothetical protein
VSVVQRLLVRGVGDYYFAVPAPVLAVRAAAGSQSEPGRRQGQILWQGFSPGNRVLAARADLGPAAVAAALPLRVTLSRRGNRLSLLVRNATRTRVPSFGAAADPAQVADFLDTLDAQQGRPRPDTFVAIDGPVRPIVRTAVAPVRVEGTLGGGPRQVAFRGLLTERAPTLRVDAPLVPGSRPTFRLVATPRVPAGRLAPPGGGSWRTYVRSRPRIGRRALLDTALELVIDVALAGQYDTLLANPDRTGDRASVYVFTLARPSAHAQPPGSADGARGRLPGVVFAAGLLLAGALALGWWAHS